MKPDQEIYFPCKRPRAVTRLAIAAHQDDIEIMAYSAISESCGDSERAFAAVVTADGAGSAGSKRYRGLTGGQMSKIRAAEQKKAAKIGRYQRLYLLNYSSQAVQDPSNDEIIQDYLKILNDLKPQIVYTHNPADKHLTHLGTAVKVIKAIRLMDKSARPQKLYGVEVWRGLDWLPDGQKVLLDCGKRPRLERKLLKVFKSQISAKRYDLAVIGRRISNAVFLESNKPDKYKKLSYAMDLTPLIEDEQLDIIEYVLGYIDQFRQSVIDSLNKVLG